MDKVKAGDLITIQVSVTVNVHAGPNNDVHHTKTFYVHPQAKDGQFFTRPIQNITM